MSHPADRDSEIPDGTTRRQLITTKSVRSYIRSRKSAEGNTYSEQIAQWLPEPSDETNLRLGYEDDDIVKMKLIPSLYEHINGMAGNRVTNGDIVALYALRDAIENENHEAAAAIIVEIPELLWHVADFDEPQMEPYDPDEA